MALLGNGSGGSPKAPLQYSVRVSARARRVRLVMRSQGLEVVIPRGFSQRRIPALVEGKRAWIERAAGRVAAHGARLAENPPRLPQLIELPAVGEVWAVEYRPAPQAGGARAGRSGARARESSPGRLVVSGATGDFEACRDALCRWLKRRAGERLIPRLAELAQRHGLRYQGVSVRIQRTRWGSCSKQGNISLNARLLLLPREAADYVLLHELCHTIHMDHSARFWALMQRHDPDFAAHKKLVRTSARALPTWLDHEPSGEEM